MTLESKTDKEPKPFKLRLNLPFEDGGLLFRGFLPETEADALHLRLGDDKYHITLYLSDREKQLSGFIADLPTDAEQLRKHLTIECEALTVEIGVAQPDPDVVNALEAGTPTEKTEMFGQDVFRVVMQVYNGVVSFCRNILKLSNLTPTSVDPRNYENFLDARCDAHWLDSKGQWRRFLVDRKPTVHISLTAWPAGLDRSRWVEMGSFVEKGRQAPMIDVLMVNSLQHLRQENGRLAVVEAVIALESAIEQLMPKAMLNLPGAPQLTEEEVHTGLEKLGLRYVTEVVLRVIGNWAKLEPEVIDNVIKAVEARNRVLHSAQRRIEVEEAKRYIRAIRSVIECFRSWIAKTPATSPDTGV
jgi:hypothetical protein